MPPTPPPHDTGRTRLAHYLKGHGLRQKELARAVGCSPNAVCQWLAGAYRPSLALRAALARATDGAVPAESWQTADERRAAAWRAAHAASGAADGR